MRVLLRCMEMSCKYSCPSRSTGCHLLDLRELTVKIIDAEQTYNCEHSKSFQDAIETHRETPFVPNVVERPYGKPFDGTY